jgi:hypothetical protein
MPRDSEDVVCCANCETDFAMPPPIPDQWYIPRCPNCGTVVNEYQDIADRKQKDEQAWQACGRIEEKLDEIIQEIQHTRNDIPPGGGVKTLEYAAEELDMMSEFAKEEYEKIIDE